MNTRLFNRNFNILLSGVFVKGIGTGVYEIAGMLLVLSLSGNVFYSGLAYFAISFADCLGFLIAPFANYVPYKKGLIICELLKSCLLFTIPLYAFFADLNIFYCIFILFIVALTSQFTYPIESTLVPSIVGSDNLVRANSYLNMLRESLNIVFLAVAGLVVSFIGPVHAILITACCHLVTSATFSLYRLQEQDKSDINTERITVKNIMTSYRYDFKEGIKYIQKSIIPHMVIACVFVNFFIGSIFAALPAFALIQGEHDSYYGYYMAAMSLGLLCGSIITPKLSKLPFGILTIGCAAWSGVMWIFASFISVWPSLIMYGLGFISIGVFNILMFSSIQQQVESTMIGRVITVISSAAAFSMPIGALFGGAIGSSLDPSYPVIFGGIAMLIFGGYWAIHPLLRKLFPIEKLELFIKDGNHTVVTEPVKEFQG